MNIGEVSRVSGLPVKTIRYYEDMGLITPLRQENGYRVFDDFDLNKLTLLRRSRSLGFSIKECAELLALYDGREGAGTPLTKIVSSRISDINKTIIKLHSIQRELKNLVRSQSSDSAILDHFVRTEAAY